MMLLTICYILSPILLTLSGILATKKYFERHHHNAMLLLSGVCLATSGGEQQREEFAALRAKKTERLCFPFAYFVALGFGLATFLLLLHPIGAAKIASVSVFVVYLAAFVMAYYMITELFAIFHFGIRSYITKRIEMVMKHVGESTFAEALCDLSLMLLIIGGLFEFVVRVSVPLH